MTLKPEDLLKAGAHYGHHVSRWHPKMRPFIAGQKNSVHIFDVDKTLEQLEKACAYLESVVGRGGTVLFVGTKPQVQTVIEKEATRMQEPYVNQKWLGGFLTNFPVVTRLVKRYKELVKQRDGGDLQKYTKKEQLGFEKEIKRLYGMIGGVLGLERVPETVFVWDCKREKTALKEAKKRGITVVGVCDTNTNTALVDYVIPLNDDSTKTIQLIMPYIADRISAAQKKVVV